MLKTYAGRCHCGAVKFEADLDLGQSSFRCNCSICRRNRFWVAVARPEGFRLLAGAVCRLHDRWQSAPEFSSHL